MNGELYSHDVTDSVNFADRTDAREHSDHELWKFITLERIGWFCSSFQSWFFWFFFINWRKENPSGLFPFNNEYTTVGVMTKILYILEYAYFTTD